MRNDNTRLTGKTELVQSNDPSRGLGESFAISSLVNADTHVGKIEWKERGLKRQDGKHKLDEKQRVRRELSVMRLARGATGVSLLDVKIVSDDSSTYSNGLLAKVKT